MEEISKDIIDLCKVNEEMIVSDYKLSYENKIKELHVYLEWCDKWIWKCSVWGNVQQSLLWFFIRPIKNQVLCIRFGNGEIEEDDEYDAMRE